MSSEASTSPSMQLWAGVECTVNRVGNRFFDQLQRSGHANRLTDIDLFAELGIRPIVGLVHHGSGPHHTNLLDPSFAEGLAEFACAVAERYPWVDAYTPVNEPLTTAQFSGLYFLMLPPGGTARHV